MYEIVGDARQATLAQLPDILRSSEVHYSGWPPFWYPRREGVEPYPRDGAVECWFGGDPQVPVDIRDPAHSDFWRITPDGRAYLLRGYDEDVEASRYNARSPLLREESSISGYPYGTLGRRSCMRSAWFRISLRDRRVFDSSRNSRDFRDVHWGAFSGDGMSRTVHHTKGHSLYEFTSKHR